MIVTWPLPIGIGLTYNNSPIINNTIISIPNNGRGTITCHWNILKYTNSSSWILPATSYNSSAVTIERGGGEGVYTYVSLTIYGDGESEGNYYCALNGSVLSVWIITTDRG